jgi:hypothetical protein
MIDFKCVEYKERGHTGNDCNIQIADEYSRKRPVCMCCEYLNDRKTGPGKQVLDNFSQSGSVFQKEEADKYRDYEIDGKYRDALCIIKRRNLPRDTDGGGYKVLDRYRNIRIYEFGDV